MLRCAFLKVRKVLSPFLIIVLLVEAFQEVRLLLYSRWVRLYIISEFKATLVLFASLNLHSSTVCQITPAGLLNLQVN